MSEAYGSRAFSAPVGRSEAVLRVAEWLSLAAAPSFAAMALLTGLSGEGRMAAACGIVPSFLHGMVPMYLLMSGFHSAPWLKLIAERRRRGAVHSDV